MNLSLQSSKIISLKSFTRNLSAVQNIKTHLNQQLEAIKEAGTYKKERVIVTSQGSHIRVAGNNRQILNFCANNYLGLAVCDLFLKNVEKNRKF
jgi:7-keto-8-aminopelargonate synthetase-like enzyme